MRSRAFAVANAKLIVFTGIDGSGKTTIARSSVAFLRAKGYKTRYVWIKSLHTLAYVISVFFVILKGHQVIINPNKIPIRRFDPSYYANLKCCWALIELISIVPLFIVNVLLPSIFGYIVVLDRCPIDTIVTVSTRIKNPMFANGLTGKLMLSLLPKESIMFHFDANLATILKRRPEIEYSKDEIFFQMYLYRSLTGRRGAMSINTAKTSRDEVFDQILEGMKTAGLNIRKDEL